MPLESAPKRALPTGRESFCRGASAGEYRAECLVTEMRNIGGGLFRLSLRSGPINDGKLAPHSPGTPYRVLIGDSVNPSRKSDSIRALLNFRDFQWDNRTYLS